MVCLKYLIIFLWHIVLHSLFKNIGCRYNIVYICLIQYKLSRSLTSRLFNDKTKVIYKCIYIIIFSINKIINRIN